MGSRSPSYVSGKWYRSKALSCSQLMTDPFTRTARLTKILVFVNSLAWKSTVIEAGDSFPGGLTTGNLTCLARQMSSGESSVSSVLHATFPCAVFVVVFLCSLFPFSFRDSLG